MYNELLKRMAEILTQIKKLEEEKTAISNTICLLFEEGELSPDDLAQYGLVYSTRRNGYDQSIIPLLKQKGLRDAIAVEEKVINKAVDLYVKAGVISKEEAAMYEKPMSKYIALSKSSSQQE